MENVNAQFYAFFVTVAIGFITGIIFDFYRIIRNFLRPRKFGTGIGDLLFWIIVTAVIFVLLLYGNWGQLRLYVFIGLAIGVRVYLRLFSRFFIRLFKGSFILIGKIIDIIKRILGFLWQVILFPLKILKNIVFIPLGFLGLAFSRSWNLVGGFAKKLLLRPVNTRYLRAKRKIYIWLTGWLKKK